MNIEIANRLLQYRKSHNLSQEELAEKLNISRQSVSKWERAESCPDTDNLIELAKIYNITIDELLNGQNELSFDESKEPVTSKTYDNVIILDENELYENSKEENVSFTKQGLKISLSDQDKTIPYENVYVKVKNENVRLLDASLEKKYEPSITSKKIKDAICGGLILLIVLLYVGLCSLNLQEWGKFWIIFVAYPFLTSIIESIVKKDIGCFAFPIFIIVIYLILGVYFSLWHPFWFLFLLIPIYYIFIDAFKKKITLCYYENNQEVTFLINKGDIYIVK